MYDKILKTGLLLLMMTMGGSSALADTWDGSTKYTTIAAAGITGDGKSAETAYTITNANQFVAFGILANNSTAYWKLTADIDLGGHEWPYSGDNAKTFKGHFDGQNHTISKYTITPITNKANGLFGTVQGSNATTGRAEIKDLKIDDVTIVTTAALGSTTYIGALVGNASQYVDFSNVLIVDANSNGKTVTITLDNINGNCNIGVFAGAFQKNSTMKNCTVNKPVINIQGAGTVGGGSNIGGVIGNFTGASGAITSITDPTPSDVNTTGLTVTSPSVTINKIASTWYIGSVFGRINNYSDVQYVKVDSPRLTYNTVGSPNNALYLGILAGHIQGNAGSATAAPVSTPVKNISITGTSLMTIGTGSEELKNVKAGIVGQATTNVDIDTWNIGTSNITVKGSLTTSTNYFGGVIGHAQSNSSAHDSDTQTKINNVTLGSSTITVTGNVVKEAHIGHFFGRIEGQAGNATTRPKRTLVSNLTTTGTTKIVFGSDSKKVDVANVRAGAIGSAAVNSDISTCTLADTEIEVNGNLATGSSYLGGIVGQVQSSTTAFPGVAQGAVATKVHGITVKKSDVNVTGNVGVQCYVGGGFGQVTGATSTTVEWQPTEITDIDIKNTSNTGISSVTIGTSNSNTINYVRAGGVIGMAGTNIILDDWDIEKINVQINGKLLTTSSNIGGCVGTLQSVSNAPAKATNIKITKSDIVAINGDIEKEAYIGGVFGRMDGSNNTQNQPATATNVTVAGLDMTFGGDFKQNVYAGGIVGYLYAMNKNNTDPTSVTNCTVGGQIHSSGTPTLKEGLYYAFGGIVGYNNQNNTTNQSKVSQCLSEVDIDLSGYTPATATNLTKMFFIVGGVIGRLDNPSLLPEHLYYSGKINAPYATVGPIVGTFYKNAGAQYVYEDYSGEYAVPTLTSQEWEKANTWYYNNYQLGLSSDVRTQTARTKNYSATTNIDGVEYLTITDKTFSATNSLNGGKVSQTVLRYTANNKDIDFGIYPQWSTSSSAYPTYYMYYMQGVNRGVYMENANFAKELVKNELSISPSMQTAQSDGNYTFTTSLGKDILEKDNFSSTYQWYQKDETTQISNTTGAITLSETTLDSYGGTVYCVITVNGPNSTSYEYKLTGSNKYVVFIDGASGVDAAGRGWTPETPVKTIDYANSLLRPTANNGTWDNNIIVVMGLLNEDYVFQSTGNNPATLTGKWDGKDYNGVIRIKQIFPPGGEHNVNLVNQPGKTGTNCYILGDTKFENLIFYGMQEGNSFIELHGHDAIFGEGLVMQNFKKLANNHGNMGGKENIPEFTIILTATNLSEADIKTYTQNRTKPQEVTFKSGHYGRIMAGRFTQNFFAHADNTAHSILASAANPIWAVVNIDIDKNNEMTDGKGNVYTCDINALIAGLTDGSMYGDYTTNFHGGSVAYIVGGNQGNPVNNGSLKYTPLGGTNGAWGQWPNASFFGRSVINVEQNPELKAINVGNLYAGGLGRQIQTGTTSATVDMYMYGRTEVNVKSGTIAGSVYGGGVGGVIGINPWDAHLPYATEAADADNNAIMNKVQYGDTRYGTWSSMVKGTSPLTTVTLHNWNSGTSSYDTENLDISASSTTVNISGGDVNGNVYGGGYGFVQDMPIEAVMQGVGSVFGRSNINITGGTIGGSVYGGSEGATNYYGGTNRYGQKVSNIAEMNGTVNLNISGTESKYPVIKGNVYGAGKGIVSGYNATTKKNEEYLRIATVGNSELGDYTSTVNITVDLPTIADVEFPFDIYGGGEMGKVDGNTTITLKGGNLTGNVYGGGLGEAGHIEKAKVVGNTTINMTAVGDPVHPLSIGKNDAAKNIYGGGNLAQLEGNTTLNLNHGSIVGNVYGGGKGLSKAESGAVTGYGKVTGSSTITMNNTTPATSISGDIFGGGALGELTGNTTFTINNGTVRSYEDVGGNTVGGYVYGGGALADVGGNTTVNLFGGSVAGAYGGGLGSNDVAAIVGGNATVQLGTNDGTASSKVTGAGLFGGNNLNGTPKGHAFVHVLNTTDRGQANRNETGTVANFDVAAVYGGGNQAAYEPTDEHDYAQVLIENCDNSIAYVYGGGNAAPVPATQVVIHGANAIDNAFAGGNGSGEGNLGADIGYLGYARDDIHKYGDGTASIAVDGGTIHNVYGGSNTLGYIRTSTSVNVASSAAGSCPINVTHTYGGGNKADLTCDITMNMTCEKGVKTLFAGANQANVLGDATLNIYSGVYEQVFGGNNQSGVIKGKLTVNVDETGCYPIEIGELYGCGNDAPYSVYGYNSDNTPRHSLAGLSQGTIADERLPYGDPEVNVISCTKIGRIFGGGYSTGATVYGNTHVNVNLIEGRWSGQEVQPEYKLDANYQMVSNTETYTNPKGFGTIGNIYGGGNAAGVVGNTYVNIFTSQYNSHIENPDTDYVYDKLPKNSGVNIEGDVFGGSKGSASNPEAGKVTGTTNVVVGYE